MMAILHVNSMLVIALLWWSSVGQENTLSTPHMNTTRHHHHSGSLHHHNHLIHNASLPHFRAIANRTYAKVLPCLTSAWMLAGQNRPWHFPADAEAHYEELKNKTLCYRSQPVHEYIDYAGPWIENQFITRYIDKPLGFFRGFIPLFIQWIDNQILRGRYFDYIYAELGVLLRPNVMYLAISQGDVGLGKIGTAYPNIFVLSAGGFGHVILPLIKSYIPPMPPPASFPVTIGFYGNIRQSTRSAMFSVIKDEMKKYPGFTFKEGTGPNWKEDMSNTKFNLAPRGYGRSSFRFAEAIQIGRIPIFLYNDLPWAPYDNSDYDIRTYGFVAGLTANFNNLPELVYNLTHMSDEEYKKRLAKLHEVAHAFTYDSVFYELYMFLRDPFGPHGGHLTCTKHPRTERCCDN